MSIGAGIVIAVPFKKVDSAPDAKACSECDHESLEDINCAVKEIHDSRRNPNPRNALFCRFFAFSKEPKTLFSLVLSFLNAYLRRWVSLLS